MDGPKKLGKFDEYEVKNALETLTKAKEIEANTELMAEVRKLAAKQHAHLSSVVKAPRKKGPKNLEELRAKANGFDPAEEKAEGE